MSSNRFLSDFNEKKNYVSNVIKILPVGAEFFHADGLTNMTKLIVAFRNFANAPTNVFLLPRCEFNFMVVPFRTLECSYAALLIFV
jgi:hypothetical protein